MVTFSKAERKLYLS